MFDRAYLLWRAHDCVRIARDIRLGRVHVANPERDHALGLRLAADFRRHALRRT